MMSPWRFVRRTLFAALCFSAGLWGYLWLQALEAQSRAAAEVEDLRSAGMQALASFRPDETFAGRPAPVRLPLKLPWPEPVDHLDLAALPPVPLLAVQPQKRRAGAHHYRLRLRVIPEPGNPGS